MHMPFSLALGIWIIQLGLAYWAVTAEGWRSRVLAWLACAVSLCLVLFVLAPVAQTVALIALVVFVLAVLAFIFILP